MILNQLEVAKQFTKDGKKWALTAKDIAKDMGISIKKSQAILNSMVAEGYLDKQDNDGAGVGTKKIYFINEYGIAILLT